MGRRFESCRAHHPIPAAAEHLQQQLASNPELLSAVLVDLMRVHELASSMNSQIHLHDLLARLRASGATGVDQYERKLKTNEKNQGVLFDLLFEGRAALMFPNHHWKVHLRDSPEIELRCDGELPYAEVKHFRTKEQDALDEQATRRGAKLGNKFSMWRSGKQRCTSKARQTSS